MSIVPSQAICRAPNAFSVPKYLCRIFSASGYDRPVRWLSSSRPFLQQAAEQVKSEEDTAGDVLFEEPPIQPPQRNRLKYYHRLRPSKKYEERLQASLDPSSLAKTLENHRATNMEFLVRKVVQGRTLSTAYGKESTVQKANVEQVEEVSPTAEIDSLFEDPNEFWFEHLRIDKPRRGKGDRIVQAKKKVSAVPSLEYKGRYVKPTTGQWNANVPWTAAEDVPKHERLDLEIRRFWDWIRPTHAERAAYNAVLQQTQELIQQAQPDYTSETFGSYRTGLLLASSDLDLRFYDETNPESEQNVAPRYSSRKKNLKALHRLRTVFDAHPDYMLCNLRYARYPLISLQHKQSGIDLQIVCSNDTTEQRGFVQKYLDEYPDLAPLFAVLRTTFDIRGLMDVYRGGLGSYSLLMMIVASFKLWGQPLKHDGVGRMRVVEERYGSSENSSIGAKLRHFLPLFAYFDSYENIISIEPTGVFKKVLVDETIPKKELEKMEKYPEVNGRYKIGVIDQSQPYLLCLQDPADPFNDLGRKAYGIKHIQATLNRLHQRLEVKLKDSAYPTTSFLHNLVGPSYAIYEGRRKKMEEYGSKL